MTEFLNIEFTENNYQEASMLLDNVDRAGHRFILLDEIELDYNGSRSNRNTKITRDRKRFFPDCTKI